jgi:hypothetical protein
VIMLMGGVIVVIVGLVIVMIVIVVVVRVGHGAYVSPHCGRINAQLGPPGPRRAG